MSRIDEFQGLRATFWGSTEQFCRGSRNVNFGVTIHTAGGDDEAGLKRAAHVRLCVVAGSASASARPRGTQILL